MYEGKLPDGCMVAVKLLTKSQGNGQNSSMKLQAPVELLMLILSLF